LPFSLEGVFNVKILVSHFFRLVFLFYYSIILFQQHASLKFDIPLGDYNIRFTLWLWAILTHSDMDDALFGFKKELSTWTSEEKRKAHKSLSLIQLHLSINILQKVLHQKNHCNSIIYKKCFYHISTLFQYIAQFL
jgi:hypothetical protein